MADVIPFLAYLIYSLRIQRFDKTKKKTYFIHFKENNIRNIFPCVLNVSAVFGVLTSKFSSGDGDADDDYEVEGDNDDETSACCSASYDETKLSSKV